MISFTGTVSDIKKKLFQLEPNKKYDIEIKEHREKRSLNSNSYAWKLISEIAEEINQSKEYVYLEMLKRYGTSELFVVQNNVPIKKFYKYYEIEKQNQKYTMYKFYKGSSEFDTKEMTVFLNGIVSECKEMGLPTKEDLEIQRIIEEWEKNNEC